MFVYGRMMALAAAATARAAPLVRFSGRALPPPLLETAAGAGTLPGMEAGDTSGVGLLKSIT